MSETERRILITGAAGFIGSTYANMAVRRYPHDFFVLLDALTPIAHIENLDSDVRNAKNAAFEQVDIRDRAALEGVFDEHRITDIINFAAETHVDVSIRHPAIFIETNVEGTHNLLALALERKINRFHQISTDEVYGTLQKDEAPFSENSPLAPNNPYSASKAAADLLVRAYHKTFGLDAVITRSSNNYGPRQDKTKLIPLFITNLLKGERVPLYGTGENIRDWIFVEDNAEAIDLAFRNGTNGEVYNIGGGTERSNLEIAHALIKLTGRDESAIQYVTDRLGHDFRYAINSSKIRVLGWNAKTDLGNGLGSTVKFYEEHA
jgi:dTDP-glucose 4,6-dehydratase